MTTRAYCPAAIGFILKYCPNTDIAKSGSIGVGCTIHKGVTVEVSKTSYTTIRFNGKPISFPTVSWVVSTLLPNHFELNSNTSVCVDISSPLPLGFGFGISGASALATAFALNTVFKLNKSPQELALIAHRSEIENKTGLGTVATQISGGFLFKRAPGIPVEAISYPFIGQKLYAIIIGQLKTPTILKNKNILHQINKAANKALSKITSNKNITTREILQISYLFVKDSTLLDSKLDKIIQSLNAQGITATMAILGKVILCDKMPKLQLPKKYRVEELVITNDRVHLLNEE